MLSRPRELLGGLPEAYFYFLLIISRVLHFKGYDSLSWLGKTSEKASTAFQIRVLYMLSPLKDYHYQEVIVCYLLLNHSLA